MKHNVVLMIDEDHEFASIIKTKLEHEGFDIRLAGTPDTGMQMIREVHPDLVLLDINLPGMNGIDFLGAMKQDNELKQVRVAFFSSLVNPWTNFVDIREAAKELGAVSFIDKATALDELVEQIRVVLSDAGGNI